MLFTVMILSFPIAWLKLDPKSFLEYSQSILSAIFFCSNIFFYFVTTDYGADASLLKPFLHTWSLGIEEQFYIVFPVLLLFIYKFERKHVISIFLGLAFLSLLWAEFDSHQNPSFNFYMPMSRFWELAIGSLLAFTELKIGRPRTTIGSRVLPCIGLILILYAIICFNDETPHPSFATFIPVAGVALIIMLSSAEDPLGRFLGSKPFVKIGLISYSAYLWHFPIFAFARIGADSPGNWDKFFLFVFTLILSVISYFLIEQPFRNRSKIGLSKFAFSIVLSLTVLILLQTASIAQNGFDFIRVRSPFETDILKKSAEDFDNQNVKKDILILGDSHARHFEFGLNYYTKGRVLEISSGGCIPFYNVDRYDYRFVRGNCARMINDALTDFIEGDRFSTLVMSSMGPVYLTDTAFNDRDLHRVKGQGVEYIGRPEITDRWKVFEMGMRETFAMLSESGKKVIYIIDVPELGRDNKECLSEMGEKYRIFGPKAPGRIIKKSVCRVNRTEFDERVKRFHSLIKSVGRDFPKITIIDPTDIFCDRDYCYGYREDYLLYADYDHLNNNGSLAVAEKIMEHIH